MKITSFMKQQHSKNRAAKRLKAVLSLVLAVSLMLSTLCILVLNVAAEVLPIDNDLVDGISMRLFNYGSSINRYMRNTDSTVGRMGDYYYNSFGNMVNTYGGGYLPFVDNENGSGPSVDHTGLEGAMQHSYPNMSTVLGTDGMPVVNEQPTSTLYQPNGFAKNYFFGNNSTLIDDGVKSIGYNQGNEYKAIKYVPASGVSSYPKAGIAFRSPGFDKTFNLVSDRNNMTFSGWIYVDFKDKAAGETISDAENGLLLSFIPKGCWANSESAVGYSTSTSTMDNNSEFWAYRKDLDGFILDDDRNVVSFVDGWNYFEIPGSRLNSAQNNTGYTKYAWDKYNADSMKQIEAILVYENSRANVSKYNEIKIAGLKVTHTNYGTMELLKDEYFKYNDGVGSNYYTTADEKNKGTVSEETVVIERSQDKDKYFCDIHDHYKTTDSNWYSAVNDTYNSSSNSSGKFTAAANTRKRGMTVSTNVQIPYFMDYLNKYTLELDLYFDDTYFHDGNALTQNMIVSLLTEGYADQNSTNNNSQKNLTEDYSIRYLLFNENQHNEAPTIKAGWNHLSIPLTAKNWVHSTSNTAPYDKLVQTGIIAGISFHENNANYTGTYDFGVGNISIKKDNGVGIYPTYYNLVTVNGIKSNTSTYSSTITESMDGLKSQVSGKTNALVIDDAAYSNSNTTTQGGTHRKQGILVTNFNDTTDYRYIKNTAPQNTGTGQVEYYISTWIYLEPKNGDWTAQPDTNLLVCLISEGGVNRHDYVNHNDSNYNNYVLGTVSTVNGMGDWSEHFFYRQAIDRSSLEWGWNHMLLAITKGNFLSAKTTPSSSSASDDRTAGVEYWDSEIAPNIVAFENTGRIDGFSVHEMDQGGAADYNLALGEFSIMNFNDSGSLGYLFDPSKATTSQSEYQAGMADRLNASGDADAYEGGPYWHNDYDDAAYRYQSAYFPVDQTSSGLFQYDKATGTYYYKSNRNAASYNMDTGKFDLYDYTVNRYNKGYEYYTEGEDAGYPLDSFANFYPFNTGHTQGALNYNNTYVPGTYFGVDGKVSNTSVLDGFDATKPNGVIPDNYSLYQNSKETEVDLSYGFSFNFDFYMPKKGITAEGNEMIFSFTGDDDIWVYIDGVLFLDIGGAHPPRTGSINFATGVIKYQNLENTSNGVISSTEFEYTSIKAQLEKAKAELEAAGLTAGERYTKIVSIINDLVPVTYTDDNGATQTGYTFKDYSMHDLDFFYLERGGSDSCCKIEFNLEPLPEQSLSVTKSIDEVNSGIAGELYFTFKLTDENGSPITQWPYEICYKGTSNSFDGIQRYTGDDGTFIVVGETTALFKDIPVNTRFQIQETAESQDSFSASNNITGNSLSTGILTMPDTPLVVEYTNKPVEPRYTYYLRITKQLNGEDPIPDRVFDMVLEFDLNRDDNYIPYTGTAIKTDVNGSESKVNIRDGAIKLKATESVYIDGLCPDLKYRIKELAPTQYVEGYEFLDPVINQQTVGFGEFGEFTIAADGMLNNEIAVYNTIRETYGDIRITKEGVEAVDHHEDETPDNTEDLGKQELQTTIFNIKGTEDRNSEIDFDIVITGNDSKVIRDLPTGVYDVTEKTDWSWRYSPDNATKQVEVKAAGTASSQKLVEAKSTNDPVEYGSTLIESVEPKGSVEYKVIDGQTAYSYVFNANSETANRKDGMYISVGDKKVDLVGYEENYTVKMDVYISDITDYYLLFQFIPTDYLITGSSGIPATNYTEYWAYRYTLSNDTVTYGTHLVEGWNTLEIPLSSFKSGLNENGIYTGPAFNALAQDGRLGYITVHENVVDSYATEYTFAIKSVELISNMPELKFTNSRENIYYLSGDNVKVNTFNQ